MSSASDTQASWLARRFELNRGGSANNLRPMEGLRGLAVFLVFVSHYAALVRPWIEGDERLLGLTFRLIPLGGSGVDLFFVLSGFLIYGSLIGRPRRFLPYFRRRLVRLYPAFTVVFLAYVALSFLFPGQSKIPDGAGPAAAYLLANFAMLPGLAPIEPMITVAWSLSYEIAYYVAIPVLIGVLGLRRWSSRGRAWFFLGLSLASFTLFCLVPGPVRLTSFLAGILLFEVLSPGPGRGPSAPVGAGALALAMVSTQCTFGGEVGYSTRIALLFVFFFLACWSAFGRPESPFARGLCFTPLRWLGNMSYSYYLMHALALHGALLVLERFVPPDGQGPAFFYGWLGPMFVATLIPSALLYLWVERPFSLAGGTQAKR